MANTSKSRSSGSSRGSKKSTSKSSARTNSSRRTTKSAPAQTESGFSVFLKKFASSKAAMPLIFIAAVLLIVGLDLLISWNKYDMFFTILGVEILIAVVVWVILTLVFSRRSKDTDSDTVEDEV